MKICGNCSDYYCGRCINKEEPTDALDIGCSNHRNWNSYEYKTNRR